MEAAGTNFVRPLECARFLIRVPGGGGRGATEGVPVGPRVGRDSMEELGEALGVGGGDGRPRGVREAGRAAGAADLDLEEDFGDVDLVSGAG
jgi:hypothetical protein